MSFSTQDSLKAGSNDSRVPAPPTYGAAPWLLKRTSITVESTCWRDDVSDQVSTCSTTRGDEKHAIRSFVKSKFDSKDVDDFNNKKFLEDPPPDYVQFGTVVSIEASHPLQRRHEMKGLEQAASMKRWAGDGRPAEAWGKLIKDPELWDAAGDTLVYYGYQRPQASFRVLSSILEETKSDLLLSKLQQGYKRTAKLPFSGSSSSSSSLRGFKNLALGNGSIGSLPSLPETGNSVDDVPIQYEFHLPPPEDASKIATLRHYITTRNFFALLLNKPIVGLTFYQALVDLHDRLELYMPGDVDCTQIIVKYLIKNRLHNVSNDPIAAAGLLAWSEDPQVHWPEGWREGFVHCCGLYANLQSLPEIRDLSDASRALLERSVLELQTRVQGAADRLARFSFDEMWPENTLKRCPGRANYDRCAQFFRRFYEQQYKRWPPKKMQPSNGCWLTRDIVSRLQRDFGALYDYYVDRDVIWEERKGPRERQRDMIRKTDTTVVVGICNQPCLAEIFSYFDRKHNYPHIPHPHPLLPNPISDHDSLAQRKETLFGSRSKNLEKRINEAYSEACNAKLLPKYVTSNALVEEFVRFEKTDMLGKADLHEARQARWVLLYGILQVLASISVDTPNLYFTTDASYFLNPRLEGMPPWNTDPSNALQGASSTGSYCWTVPYFSWHSSPK